LKLSEWIHVLMLMICLYMWIEWLIVVDIEFMCQKSYMWICYVFVKKWWMMKLYFGELGMNSWLIVVDDVWKHVVDELVWWLCLLVIWWWKLLLLWNNYESLVNFELGQNGVWFISFEHSWVCVYVYDL